MRCHNIQWLKTKMSSLSQASDVRVCGLGRCAARDVVGGMEGQFGVWCALWERSLEAREVFFPHLKFPQHLDLWGRGNPGSSSSLLVSTSNDIPDPGIRGPGDQGTR